MLCFFWAWGVEAYCRHAKVGVWTKDDDGVVPQALV